MEIVCTPTRAVADCYLVVQQGLCVRNACHCTWNLHPFLLLWLFSITLNYNNSNTFINPTNILWIQYFVANIMVLLMSDFRFSVFGLFAVIISWLLSSLYLATAVVSIWLLLFQNELMNVRFDVSKVVLLNHELRHPRCVRNNKGGYVEVKTQQLY